MTIAILCTVLLGILVFGLGLAVSLTRAATGTNIGHSSDPTDRVHKIVRAHGNATEYVPILAVLILFLGSREPATWVLWVMGLVTAMRYLHAAGLIFPKRLDTANLPRFVGGLSTYLLGLALCYAAYLEI